MVLVTLAHYLIWKSSVLHMDYCISMLKEIMNLTTPAYLAGSSHDRVTVEEISSGNYQISYCKYDP